MDLITLSQWCSCDRVDPGLAGVRRASFGQCGMDFATTTMGTAAFRRLSNAADKAAEARNRLSAQFELGAITALPVKRLSEELAAVLKKRDSWSASVSPLPLSLSQPDIVKADTGRSPCEAPSCSQNCKASVTSGPVKVTPLEFLYPCNFDSEGSGWTYSCWPLQAIGSIPSLI